MIHALQLLLLCLCVVQLLAGPRACGSEVCSSSVAEEADAFEDFLDREELDEADLLEVTLLQTQLHKQRTAVTPVGSGQLDGAGDAATHVTQADDKVISLDHHGKVCMLCSAPLPERLGSRSYTEFRKDCGSRSSPTGPSAEDMALPAVQLWQKEANSSESAELVERTTNGFCELNFAKSCADALVNEDYLYFPKSLDLEHPSMRLNVGWDGRYCHLNGFLEPSVVALQHNFTALRDKARGLCSSKYSKHGIDRLTFLDMLEKSRHEDESSPSLEEAEQTAAWNCAMGDLGCDMAMCAYSFCRQDGGKVGLYSECAGWDPVMGMPF